MGKMAKRSMLARLFHPADEHIPAAARLREPLEPRYPMRPELDAMSAVVVSAILSSGYFGNVEKTELPPHKGYFELVYRINDMRGYGATEAIYLRLKERALERAEKLEMERKADSTYMTPVIERNSHWPESEDYIKLGCSACMIWVPYGDTGVKVGRKILTWNNATQEDVDSEEIEHGKSALEFWAGAKDEFLKIAGSSS